MIVGFRRLQPRIDDSRIKLVVSASAESMPAGLPPLRTLVDHHINRTASFARLPEVNIAILGPVMAGDGDAPRPGAH
jgi:hypothetical protein